jgi:cytochrome c2
MTEDRSKTERRRERREHRRRTEALGWWRQPGVLVFGVALLLALAGMALVLREGQRIPVDEAEVEGLRLRLVQARWILDQMDHGENFQKPSVMMPDMPEWGSQRVTLDLALDNNSTQAQVFDGGEFTLVPQFGEEVPPMGANVGFARIEPGQSFNTALHFDFDTREPHGRLQVEWQRRGESVFFAIPAPAEHYHLRPRGGEISLPPDVRVLMPLGKADRGANLYVNVFGCVACHGQLDQPGSNNVGPHLAGIATAGAARIEGVPAAQYIYESIVAPTDFIAPECRNGEPCTAPSAMPEYASLMKPRDVADLVSYLMEQP